jgi:asparagine synthase (glutamine-hydrolysing)
MIKLPRAVNFAVEYLPIKENMELFADILLDTSEGWRRFKARNAEIWIKGYVYNMPDNSLADLFVFDGSPLTDLTLTEFVGKLDGHFGLVIQTSDWCFAAVDQVRSIPLLFSILHGKIIIGSKGEHVREAARIGSKDFNQNSVLAFSLSGFTPQDQTIYNGVKQLESGQTLFYKKNSEIELNHHYRYRPRAQRDNDLSALQSTLTELTLNIHRKLIDSAQGRPIYVPLSAGLDSRCVVSALSKLGYRNVHCFAYGIPNNYEAKASKAIAEQLGYSWEFIPLSYRIISQDFKSNAYSDYLKFADTCASVPVIHEFSVIKILKESGRIPEDAILVNGMSGDFLTGSHIPTSFFHKPSNSTMPKWERKERILTGLISKHYSLWNSLKTKEKLEQVKQLLWEEIEKIGGLEDIEDDYGLYEFSECINRQSKYVVTVQRIYEFFGYDWRLPLWDCDFMKFWEMVPLEAKKDRVLFSKMLNENNWCGVWKGIPTNVYISPRWIHFFRLPAKVIFAPLPRKYWQSFDHRIFQYWMEILRKSAIVPYYKVVLDNRGYRSAVSWLVEKYLNGKGLNLEGGVINGVE